VKIWLAREIRSPEGGRGRGKMKKKESEGTYLSE
jgi:hypothetical protein